MVFSSEKKKKKSCFMLLLRLTLACSVANKTLGKVQTKDGSLDSSDSADRPNKNLAQHKVQNQPLVSVSELKT